MNSKPLYALERHSFSDEAARRLQEESSRYSDIVNVEKIQDVQKAVLNEDAYGLIPIENSSGGLVVPHVDWLSENDVRVVQDIRHQICMCVGGKGTAQFSARSVHSHQKALEQCSQFLIATCSKLEQVAHSSTRAAARSAAEADEPRLALASRSALEAEGLPILWSDVANDKGANNITQFYVVKKNGDEELPHQEAIHHAAVITPKNEVGVLHHVLSLIANARVNLTSLHSRPIGIKEYRFFAEMERVGSEKQFSLLSQQMEEDDRIKSMKWLGSWNNA